MGSFYTNITLRGPEPEPVAAALAELGRTAIVTPAVNGYVTVFDETCESQDVRLLDVLAGDLSRRLACAALAALNHDDDVLVYRLYDRGALVDHYESAPGWDTGEDVPPEGGQPAVLCRVLGVDGDQVELEAILRASDDWEDGYLTASDRHADLVETLGIPLYVAGLGYTYVTRGEAPAFGLDPAGLRRVG